MLEIRYQIPNVPQASVPHGTSEEDNEELERGGKLPNLQEGALRIVGNWLKSMT